MSEYTPETWMVWHMATHVGQAFSGTSGLDRWYEAEKRKWQAEALRAHADAIEEKRRALGIEPSFDTVLMELRTSAVHIEQEARDDRADA